MAGFSPRPCALLLALALVPGPARADTTVAVMVLCPEGLPEGIPTCEEVAEALDAELEEFSMYAVTGPSPKAISPKEVASPGVPFVIWTSGIGDELNLHVYDADTKLEITKSLDLALMDELPSAYDLAILYTNLMGTALYSELASLNAEELIDLAVPEPKEAKILERAAAGLGKAEIPLDLKMWFPQFVMGWSLVSYPGMYNADHRLSDVYNGLHMGLRFPLRHRFWAGASVIITQSMTSSFFNSIPSEYRPENMDDARFIDDQVVIDLDAAWYPVQTKRWGLWIAAGPGITRTSTRLMVYGSTVDTHGNEVPSIESKKYTAYRMTLNAATGAQLTMAPRMQLELAIKLAYVFTIKGPRDNSLYFDWIESGISSSYRYFDYGAMQLSVSLALVFG